MSAAEQRRVVAQEVSRNAAASGQIDVDIAAKVVESTLDFICWPASAGGHLEVREKRTVAGAIYGLVTSVIAYGILAACLLLLTGVAVWAVTTVWSAAL